MLDVVVNVLEGLSSARTVAFDLESISNSAIKNIIGINHNLEGEAAIS